MPRTNKSGRGAQLILSEEVEYEQFLKLRINHLEKTRTEEKQSNVIRRSEAGAQLNVQNRAEFRAVAGRQKCRVTSPVRLDTIEKFQNTEISFYPY